MEGNYIISVVGSPAIGKTTYINYLKDILFKDHDIRVVTPSRNPWMKENTERSEREIREIMRREIREGFEQGSKHVLIDGGPYRTGEISFYQTIGMELGAKVIVCRLRDGGKLKKHDDLYEPHLESQENPELFTHLKVWFKNTWPLLKKEAKLILPRDLTIKITYPNDAVHLVEFWFESESIMNEWLDNYYAIMTKEKPENA